VKENIKIPRTRKPKRQKAEKEVKGRRIITPVEVNHGSLSCEDNRSVGGIETEMEVCP
jgi:hypothetical protein